MDIKSEYLQGKTIERDVFLKANNNELWKLKTTVYRLCVMLEDK